MLTQPTCPPPKKQPTSEFTWLGVCTFLQSHLTQNIPFWFLYNSFFPFDILQCSAACGRGVKSRKVSCVTGSGRPVPEENCQHLSPKPGKQRRCRGGRCPKWNTSNWGEVGLSDPAIKHSFTTHVLTLPDLHSFFFPPLSTLMLTSLLASVCLWVKTSAAEPDCIYTPCQATN